MTPHKCDVCEKQFTRIGNLKVHMMAIHEGLRTHECEVCGKSFSQKAHLNRHLLIHSGMRSLKCELCEKRFIENSSLRKHMMIHEGIRPHECKVCGKQFSQLGHLKRHAMIHDRIRLHECKACSKRFICKETLDRHLLIHSGTKPFTCEICKKQFTQKSSLNDHLFRHGGMRPHKCEMCEKQFTSIGNLREHMMVHEGKKLHTCKVCEKEFAQSRYLKRHMMIHERKRQDVSKGCDTSSTLEQHLNTHSFPSAIKDFKQPHVSEQFTSEEQHEKLGVKSTDSQVLYAEAIISKQHAPSVNESLCINLPESFESLNSIVSISSCKIIEEPEIDNIPGDFTADDRSPSLIKEQDCSQTHFTFALSDSTLCDFQNTLLYSHYWQDTKACGNNSTSQVSWNYSDQILPLKSSIPVTASDYCASSASGFQSLPDSDIFTTKEQNKLLDLAPDSYVLSVQPIVSEPVLFIFNESGQFNLDGTSKLLNEEIGIPNSTIIKTDEMNKIGHYSTGENSALEKPFPTLKELDCCQTDIDLTDSALRNNHNAGLDSSHFQDIVAYDNGSVFEIPYNDLFPPCKTISIPEINSNCVAPATTDFQILLNFNVFNTEDLHQQLDLAYAVNDVLSFENIASEQIQSAVNESALISLTASPKTINEEISISKSSIISIEEMDEMEHILTDEKSFFPLHQQDCPQIVISPGLSDLNLHNVQYTASNLNNC